MKFEGRPGNIVSVGTVRLDQVTGKEWQPVTVTTYAGSWRISSDHPDLEVPEA